MDVKEEAILGEDIATHWYYVSKGRALRKILGAIRVDEVLDVGAGSGVFSRQLIDAGVCQRAVCVDPAYREVRTEKYHGHQIRFVHAVNQHSHKLVIMMDVLEHVDDDVALLRDYTAGLPSDASVLITVPAFQFLWSGHDVFLEHRRRYTRTSIERVVKAANLEVIRCRYFYGLLFPIIAAVRLRDKMLYRHNKLEAKSALRQYPPLLNAALTRIHDFERVTLFPLNTIAGATIFCLARPK